MNNHLIPTSIFPKSPLLTTNIVSLSNLNNNQFSLRAEQPVEEIAMEIAENAISLISRILSKYSSEESIITAVVNAPDFLPFSFLEKGTRRGAAVCRIVRNFEELQNINQEIKQFEDLGEQFVFTKPELKEMLSFNEKAERFAEKLWGVQELLTNEFLDQKIAEELKVIRDISNNKEEFVQKFMAWFEGWFFSDSNKSRPSNNLTKDKLVKLLPIPVGTGFLVGDSYLLTNYHLIPFEDNNIKNEDNINLAKEYIVQFGYDTDALGRQLEPVEYRIDTRPETAFFSSNQNLDYTLVKLEDKPMLSSLSPGLAGDLFGWIKMSEIDKDVIPNLDADKISSLISLSQDSLENLDVGEKLKLNQIFRGDSVYMIQHPKGRRKQIILSSNRVRRIFKDCLWYDADADFSSSGSPVFNSMWELIALHNAAVAVAKLDQLDQNGKPCAFELTRNQEGEIIKRTFRIQAEQGIRISSIIQDLKNKVAQGDEGVRNFLRRFVDPSSTQEVPTPLGGSKQVVEPSYTEK